MAVSTVAQYLAALPADRRAALSAVRTVINEGLPDGYEEGTVARVPAEEHMANYQAARSLMGKGRKAGEGAAGLSRTGCAATAGLSKSSARHSAVKKPKSKR